MPQSSSSSRPGLRHLLLALILSAGAAIAYSLFSESFFAPRVSDLVRDDARLLQEEERHRLAAFHRYLLQDHDIDYRVMTLRDGGDISLVALEAFDRLGVGSESAQARGLLLVIDSGNDRVRLEVGRSLEGSFPDSFIAYVEQRQMVPFFRTGRIADGILATTELIVGRVLEEKRKGGFDGQIVAEGTGGGGAETTARIGVGETNEQTPADAPPVQQAADTQSSPLEVVGAYLGAMAARNDDPALGIYTAATQAMLRGWTVTPAQMDSVARSYQSCPVESVPTSGRYAVVRFAVEDRACTPFFLQKEDGAWRLDLATMQQAIRFGRNNEWRLAPGVDHPYGFAFSDWRFDSNGFPLRR